jgi:EmrB/QacA subfamily drug resistance transporter
MKHSLVGAGNPGATSIDVRGQQKDSVGNKNFGRDESFSQSDSSSEDDQSAAPPAVSNVARTPHMSKPMQQSSEKRAKGWVLALTSLGSLMAVLDAMVVATALSTMRVELGASLEALQWTMNAYNLSFAVLLLTGAALGDRFGRRRVFIAGLALFVAASVGCALARDAGSLIAARAIQGAGAAMIMPLAMALLSVAFPPEERGKALGIFSSITGLALIIGPVVGGAIAEGLAWQWIFWLNIPIGLALIPLAHRRIPESFGPAAAIDLIGVALVTGAALGAVWGLMRGNNAGWTSREVAAALATGLLLAIAFVLWERRAREPMVPMRFFRARAFSSGIGANFLYCAAMYGVVFLLPQFLQFAQDRNALAAGLRLLPWTATLFVVAPIAGRLVNRLGERPLVVAGLILQAAGMAWIWLIAAPDLPYMQLVVPLIVMGAGVSMAMPAAQNAVLNAVSRPEVGKAAGVFNMFRFLGGVSGIAVAGAVFAETGSFASAPAFSDGFVAALGVSALLSLAGALWGMGLPERKPVALAEAEQKA